jgi:hypothetical protein
LEEIPEKIVEVPVKSRFTFAHDNNEIIVCNDYLRTTITSTYEHLSENKKFIIYCKDVCGVKVYPVFKMPKSLPITRLISRKKVMCIGSLVVDDNSMICNISDEFIGWSLEEVAEELSWNAINNDTPVVVMNRDDVITSEIINDQIDFDTFEKYIILKNTLALFVNEL